MREAESRVWPPLTGIPPEIPSIGGLGVCISLSNTLRGSHQSDDRVRQLQRWICRPLGGRCELTERVWGGSHLAVAVPSVDLGSATSRVCDLEEVP